MSGVGPIGRIVYPIAIVLVVIGAIALALNPSASTTSSSAPPVAAPGSTAPSVSCGSGTHLIGTTCLANAVAPQVRKVYVTRTVTVTTTVTAPPTAANTPVPATSTPVTPGQGTIEQVGSLDHSTDAQFCAANQCIGAFTTEGGTIVQCVDGTYSHAGGIPGACSHHGGEQ